MSILSLNFFSFSLSSLPQVTAALVTRLSLKDASVEESPNHVPVLHQSGSVHRCVYSETSSIHDHLLVEPPSS